MNSVVWGRAASALLFLFFFLHILFLTSGFPISWCSAWNLLGRILRALWFFFLCCFPFKSQCFSCLCLPSVGSTGVGPTTPGCVCVYECVCGFREVSWKHWHHHLSFVCPKLSHVTIWRDLVSVLRNNLRVKAVTALSFLHTSFLIHIKATFSKREFAF